MTDKIVQFVPKPPGGPPPSLEGLARFAVIDRVAAALWAAEADGKHGLAWEQVITAAVEGDPVSKRIMDEVRAAACAAIAAMKPASPHRDGPLMEQVALAESSPLREANDVADIIDRWLDEVLR